MTLRILSLRYLRELFNVLDFCSIALDLVEPVCCLTQLKSTTYFLAYDDAGVLLLSELQTLTNRYIIYICTISFYLCLYINIDITKDGWAAINLSRSRIR